MSKIQTKVLLWFYKRELREIKEIKLMFGVPKYADYENQVSELEEKIELLKSN